MKTRPPCDLHIHSRFSDGALAPAEVVRAAAEAGLSAVSVTDHDTIDGQREALEAARGLSVEVLTGIEFSMEEKALDLHILGYCFDPGDEALGRRLGDLERGRIERVHTMTRLLRESGVPLEAEEVLGEAGEGTVGRPHVARILMRRGVVGSFQEAFERFIGYGGPCYVPKVVLGLEEIVGLIRGAGGVAVWAHPGWYLRDPSLLRRIVQAGIAGIEAWHPNHSEQITALAVEEARRLGLFCTGGSDYHFAEAMKAEIGGIPVPYESVLRIRSAARGQSS